MAYIKVRSVHLRGIASFMAAGAEIMTENSRIRYRFATIGPRRVVIPGCGWYGSNTGWQ